MNKPVKVVWGIATVMPLMMTFLGIVCFFAFFITKFPELTKNATPPPDFPKEMFVGIFLFYGLILAGVALGFLIVISYFIHMVRTDRLNKDQRTMWAVLFVIFRTLAMTVYWFIHVWPEEEAAAGETAQPVRRKRKD
ncbi:MAG TPA: hypothetical protein VHE12_02095 [bacterium]|nr:hypothetical protein [bacterium]